MSSGRGFTSIGIRKLRRTLLSATAAAAGMSALVPLPMMTASAQSIQTRDYNIPSQDLGHALGQFTETSRLQLASDAGVTAGKTSPGVIGGYTDEEALRKLLAGTGLDFRITAEGVSIYPGVKRSADSIGTVQVEGAGSGGAGSPVNGINGSSDVQATEGTGSYTTGAMSIASKTPLSIKETPASVSVLTSQQIADQNLITVRDALTNLPGITITPNGSNMDYQIYSRGFQVNSFEIDGGAPINTTFGFKPLINLAEYDSIQLIRGADGLMNGYGDPGGVINLVRKKPLDHNQLTYEQDFASYSDFREVLDVTGPLAFDGKLKGRLVLSDEDNGYFFKVAHNQDATIYGILEYDFGPRTVLSFGGSFDRIRDIPSFGLPRFSTGASLGLPLSTCLCSVFTRYQNDTLELFGTLEHKFSDHWSTVLKVTYTKQNFNEQGAAFAGPVDPVTLAGEKVTPASDANIPSKQIALDYTLNGAFNVFGRQQEFVVGASYSHDNADNSLVYSGDTFTNSGTSSIPVNVFTFDPYSTAYMTTRNTAINIQLATQRSTQYGAYVNFRLEPLKGLHVLLGGRYLNFDDHVVSVLNVGFPIPPATNAPNKNHSFVPNFGATYDITHNITIYGTYAGIYRPQGSNTTSDTNGNLTVLNLYPPVKGFNVEGGLKWESTNKKFNASVALYRIKQDNFLTFERNSAGSFILDASGNVATAFDLTNNVSKGVDVEAAGEILPGWQVSGSYTYNDNKNSAIAPSTPTLPGATVDTPLISIAPAHLVKIWTTYHNQAPGWLGRITIGGGLQYLSAAFNAGTVCAATGPASAASRARCPSAAFRYSLPFSFTTDGYVTLATDVQYKINDHFDLSFLVNNLTNVRTYLVSPGESTRGGNYYLPPANFRLAIKAKW